MALESVGCALCPGLQSPLVGFDQSGCLVRQSKSQRLESAELNTLSEDDARVDLVKSSGELLVRDHLADNSGHLAVSKLEHGRKSLNGEGVVVWCVCEEVGAETLLLNLLGEHGLDGLWLGHELPNLDGVDELSSLVPLAGSERLGCLHDVVTGVLRWSSEDLALVVLEHTAVSLRDDTLLDVWGGTGLRKEWDLQEHGAGKIDALQKLEVDVHVEWKLTLLLEALLLWRDLVVALDHDTLCQQLLLASGAADLLESVLGLVDESGAESAKTDLNKGSVEENLGVDVEVADRLLQVRHEHHVASLVVVVMESQEVNLAQHGASTENALAVEEKVLAESVDEGGGVWVLGLWSDLRLERSWNGLPAVLLKDLDNSRWLVVVSKVLKIKLMVLQTLK